MSAIKDGRYPIMLDRERHMRFTLNAVDEIQDKFGDLSQVSEALNGKATVKNLRWLITLLLNEGDDSGEQLTEKEVGRLIRIDNMSEITSAFYKAFSRAVNGDEVPGDETESEEGKNQVASASE